MISVKGKFLIEFQDLMKEYDHDKNQLLNVEKLRAGSHIKVWWIGPCGHSFFQEIRGRTMRGRGCSVLNCMQLKMIKTNLEKYGTENPMQNEKIKEKTKNTNLKNYGVEYTLQVKEFREKGKITSLEKYGTEIPSQSQQVKDKAKNTCVEKYGVEYVPQVLEFQEKAKNTFVKKYGIEKPLQNLEFQEKARNTCVEKYGVENPMQNPIIAERNIKNSYKSKNYNFPSGNIVKVQGYEPHALDIILKMDIPEEDILTSRSKVPNINYVFDNKKHIYYPDIYLPKSNLIIEVKSDFTYQVNLEENLLKAYATINSGFDFQFWIFNKKLELEIVEM